MRKLVLLLLLIPFISIGQTLDYGNSADAAKICIAIQENSFMTDKKADIALTKILSVIGASKRFVMLPCSNINNAVALSYKGIRYILYDKEFMSTITNSTYSWTNTFILAHEVGHHINGHVIDILLFASDDIGAESLEAQRQQELEADEFAGFILAKLGATLFQASEAINLLISDKDDTYSTHPSKSKRLNAIKIGFNKAIENQAVKYEKTTSTLTAEEYFYRAYDKDMLQDYKGAISDYSKAIELNTTIGKGYEEFYKIIGINSIAYFNRGRAKHKLQDYRGAISDYNKAIELNSDYTKVMGLNSVFIEAYYKFYYKRFKK